MNSAPERMLDDILEGRALPVDPAMSQLVAAVPLLEAGLRPAVPPMGQARALFSGGAAARRTGSPWRQLAVPSMAMLALVIAAGSVATRALPGDALYPVRKVLGAMGLAEPSTEAIDEHIVAAARLVETAERDASAGEPVRAIILARRSLSELVSASALLTDLTEEQRGVREVAITSLRERAAAIISAPGTPVAPESGNDDGSTRTGDGHGSDDDTGESSDRDEDEGPSADDDDGSDDSGSDRDDDGDDRSESESDGDDDSGSDPDDSSDEPDDDEPDADAIDPDGVDLDEEGD